MEHARVDAHRGAAGEVQQRLGDLAPADRLVRAVGLGVGLLAAGSSPGLQCCVDLEFRACSSTAGEPGGIHIVERAGRRRRC